MSKNISLQQLAGNQKAYGIDEFRNMVNYTSGTNKAIKVMDSTILRTQPKIESPQDEKESGEIETGEIETGRVDGARVNKNLLRELKSILDDLNEVNKNDDVEGRKSLRGKDNARMELIVQKLQKALNKARKLDIGNTQLINQVREVFYGSKVDATMSLKIDMTELDRLAEIDFSQYDDKGVSEKYSDPNIQHRYSDRTLLGEEFMIDDSKITCTSTYKLTMN